MKPIINNIEIFYLWGLPIAKSKISPLDFDKKNIVKKIEKNYKLLPRRESNLKNNYGTDIHQSLYDNSNVLKDPQYESLKKPYSLVIKNYINTFHVKENLKFEFSILNYTASNEKSYLAPHCHEDSDFAMTHYIKFDKTNDPTTFVNPYVFNDFWIRQNKLCSSVSNNIHNSWLFDTWTFETEEDDILIFPAILKHFANIRKSNNIRITLATNVKIS
jgi:hypothetical protein